MDEDSLQNSLLGYQSQLEQVQNALAATGTGTSPDLLQLKMDLQQIIELTEASLLSMKKSKLMAIVEDFNSTESKPSSSADMDAEFAAFQEAIAGDDDCGTIASTSTGAVIDKPHSRVDGQEAADYTDNTTDIAGAKCRAPFSHDWGEAGYFNAMIIDVESLDEDSEPQVRVVFIHPTHQAMLACPYYLEDRCTFGVDDCRFSHGKVVDVCDLKEYIEPDFSQLRLDTKCLTKDAKNIWRPATVVDVLDNDQYQVMFDTQAADISTVSLDSIIPMPVGSSEGDSGSNSDLSDDDEPDLHIARSDEEDSDEDLPVYLWRPNQTTDRLAGWEDHTKGIGSQLMRNMGYIMGQGLGRNCEGRSEPVPIQLLPQGKSLDRIMELKELAGDMDLFDVHKKKKKGKKQPVKTTVKVKEKPTSVFDFLNKKLHINKHKGKLSDAKTLSSSKRKGGGQQEVKHISVKDLKQKSDKNINIQLFQTHEEMSKVQKEIRKLKASLGRHKDREPVVAKKLEQKISSMEKYLRQLQNSENSIQQQKKSRSDHKKLTIF